MRKVFCSLIAAAALLCVLTGCTAETGESVISEPSPDSVSPPTLTQSNTGTDQKVDVDLTVLSSTMVYSEVYNMMNAPDSYIGKTVKMSGQFVVYTNQDGSMFYPSVVIADATACCSQGMEFVLLESSGYPDGYPEVFTEITVIGTFETYMEDGTLYCHLVNAAVA